MKPRRGGFPERSAWERMDEQSDPLRKPARRGFTCAGLKIAEILIVLMLPSSVCADGGTLQFSEARDGFRVTLFTAPAALRAGLVDFSVLVQAKDNETPLLDVPVEVYVYREGEARRGGSATSAAATNKVFKAIQIDLPEPGRWRVEVIVRDDVRFETAMEIGPPLPTWLELLPWIGWPFAAIGLFIVHQWLVRCRLASRAA